MVNERISPPSGAQASSQSAKPLFARDNMLFLGLRLQRTLGLGHRNQRRIELHERLIDGAALGMAGLAGGGCRKGLGRLLRGAESKKRPLCWKPGLVFQVNFERGDSLLIVTALIDGSFRSRVADFQGKHGLIGPGAGLEKRFVGLWRDEDIVETLGSRVRGRFDCTVRHPES